jgi:hypothetical protein
MFFPPILWFWKIGKNFQLFPRVLKIYTKKIPNFFGLHLVKICPRKKKHWL